MNQLEKQMIALLIDLKNNYHVIGIKAEFEAEGTRIEEAMRLKDVVMHAGLDLYLKVGGCEAIKDMLDSVNLGVKGIVGPMVETPYALQKFIRAARLVYADSLDSVELLINVETMTACQNFQAMLDVPESCYLNGIVLGRVDLVGSMHYGRDAINSETILSHCLEITKKAKSHGLKVIVGGGVSVDSLPFFKAFPEGHLDRFETRKVIYSCPRAIHNPEIAFIKAIEFELAWLKNKRNYYNLIAKEDNERISMLEKRYHHALAGLKQPEKETVFA